MFCAVLENLGRHRLTTNAESRSEASPRLARLTSMKRHRPPPVTERLTRQGVALVLTETTVDLLISCQRRCDLIRVVNSHGLNAGTCDRRAVTNQHHAGPRVGSVSGRQARCRTP